MRPRFDREPNLAPCVRAVSVERFQLPTGLRMSDDAGQRRLTLTIVVRNMYARIRTCAWSLRSSCACSKMSDWLSARL